MKDTPNDHRPDDQWIAARLRVDNEFRKRLAAGLQRKFRRNFQGGMGTGYTTSDEMWCFHKPSNDDLQKWINVEGRGEARIDEDRATESTEELQNSDHAVADAPITTSTTRSHAETNESPLPSNDMKNAKDDPSQQRGHEVRDIYDDAEKNTGSKSGDLETPVAAGQGEDAPSDNWLGVLPKLRHGPGRAPA
jgi:platelet-activating factor acetylhydrolase